VEFIHVLSGRLAVALDEQEHVPGRGDSMYLDSSLPHGHRPSGGRSCSVIVVTTP